MEEQVKNIIAPLLKLDVNNIQASTVIDRSAVASSILLHRMYANLNKAGFVVHDYWNIKTYADLLQKLNGPTSDILAHMPTINNNFLPSNILANELSIGIDIEAINLMPVVVDYREDPFYVANFATTEIAYSILQPNTLATFAGLFAAKEAIVKADNNYLKIPFNQIVIDHLQSGKPVFNQFAISIAHANEYATAIAIPAYLVQHSMPSPVAPSSSGKNSITPFLALIISILALVAAIAAIYVVVIK